MKRQAALILCVMLLLASCGVEPPPEPAGYDRTPQLPCDSSGAAAGAPALPVGAYDDSSPVRYGRGFLSGDEAALYDELLLSLSSPSEGGRTAVSEGVPDERALYLADTLLGDEPAFYWARFALIREMDIRYITLSLSIPAEVIDIRQRELDERARQILASTGDSPFEKALAIHDALAAVDYDRAQEGTNSDNAYGAILEGKATCNGYARGFQYLAGLAGLEVVYIRGRSLRGSEHAWNAVKLDGAWHFADPTWDRPLGEHDDVYHDYFLIDREEMYRDRFWDESQYPALPDTEGPGFSDYYSRTGYAVDLPVPGSALEQAEILADIFYRQLKTKRPFPALAEPVFLELKIQGDMQNYLDWKEAYVRQVFGILDAMREMAAAEGFPAEIIEDVSIKCNFNDTMRVLTFYPKVKAREG